MFNRPMTQLALIALTLTGASGCGQQAGEKADATKIAQADTTGMNVVSDGHGQSHGTANGQMAKDQQAKDHQPVPKYGAGLRYEHQMQKPVQANASHSVTILIDHDYPGRNLALSANADGGIALDVNKASLPLVQGRKASWTIPFTTNSDGVAYINIFGAVQDADGEVKTRVYSVRVEVGKQPTTKPQPLKEVILPAQETIS